MRENGDKNNLIYPELSYKLMGILFKVHNKLGSNYQEKYYGRAVEQELKIQGVRYEKEKMVKINYESENIGKYFIDFVIENKIALEIKASPFFKRKYLGQVLAYLAAANLKLAILVNFNSYRLFFKRIVNPKVKLLGH